MAQDFLALVKERFGESNYAGDEYGGAGGTTGSGLPMGTPGNFMFATGIECSYPTIDNGRTRRDLLAECQHHTRYQEDLGLVRELGLKFLRYGLPYYQIQRGPGQYDWELADLALAEMQRQEITPILDLMWKAARKKSPARLAPPTSRPLLSASWPRPKPVLSTAPPWSWTVAGWRPSEKVGRAQPCPGWTNQLLVTAF